jgi:Ca2+-binding RTX toxin-like protein
LIKGVALMKCILVLLTVMAVTLVVASGVAWAVNKIGTDGPDTLRGTNEGDNLYGRGGQDDIFGLAGRDNLLGGAGKDWVLGGNERRPQGGDKNLAGGRGNDGVIGGLGSANVLGEAGNDFLGDGALRQTSKDKISGGAGNDVIEVSNRPAFEDIVVCGGGFDRVLADRKDVVAPDCERVFIGLASSEEFFESIPQSFFEGLAPFPE